MFTEMRRKDRQLTRAEAMEILERGEYGVLATLSENGYPYGVPLSYAVEDETVYFHCAAGTGLKVENIRAHPQVSFTVVGKTEVLPGEFSTRYESAVAFGEAVEAGGEEKQRALAALVRKYSSAFEAASMPYIQRLLDRTAIFAISVLHLTGKSRK